MNASNVPRMNGHGKTSSSSAWVQLQQGAPSHPYPVCDSGRLQTYRTLMKQAKHVAAVQMEITKLHGDLLSQELIFYNDGEPNAWEIPFWKPGMCPLFMLGMKR